MLTTAKEPPLTPVDETRLGRLKAAAMGSRCRRARLCLHRDHDDSLQQMVIALLRGSYIAPHRQLGRSKSYSIIDGEMVVAFFDETGRITDLVRMGPLGTGRPIVLRFSPGRWHTVVARTNHVMYTETVSGPYRPQNTDWAPWAPRNDEQLRIDEFFRAVLGTCSRHVCSSSEHHSSVQPYR